MSSWNKPNEIKNIITIYTIISFVGLACIGDKERKEEENCTLCGRIIVHGPQLPHEKPRLLDALAGKRI